MNYRLRRHLYTRVLRHLRRSRLHVHRCRITYHLKQQCNATALWFATMFTEPPRVDHDDENR